MKIELPDGRGWVAIASFVLVIVVLAMMVFDPTMKADDFFKTLATLLVGTAWVNGPVAWAFQATKTGGELADRNAALVEKRVTETPATVTVVNDPTQPIPTTTEKPE